MATSRKMNLGPAKKTKPVKGMSTINPIIKGTADILIPKTPLDFAMYAVPWAKATRAVGGITKKGAKFVAKTYRNMGR